MKHAAKKIRFGQFSEIERVVIGPEPPSVRTRRYAYEVPRQLPAALEQGLPPLNTEVDYPLPRHELDVELSVLTDRAKGQAVQHHGSEQIALGEMGSLVWRDRLSSDEKDLAVEARIPQPGGGRIPRGAGADDYDSRRVSSRSRLSDQRR
jgi:hypothetical protein